MDIHLYPNPSDTILNDSNPSLPTLLPLNTQANYLYLDLSSLLLLQPFFSSLSSLSSSSSSTDSNNGNLYQLSSTPPAVSAADKDVSPLLTNSSVSATLRIGSYVCIFHRPEIQTTLSSSPSLPPSLLAVAQLRTLPASSTPQDTAPSVPVAYCSNLALWISLRSRISSSSSSSFASPLSLYIQSLDDYLVQLDPSLKHPSFASVPFTPTIYIQYYKDLSVFLPPSVVSSPYVSLSPIETVDLTSFFVTMNDTNVMENLSLTNSPASTTHPSIDTMTITGSTKDSDDASLPSHLISVILHGTLLVSGQILSVPLYGPSAYNGIRYIRIWNEHPSTTFASNSRTPVSLIRISSTTVPVTVPLSNYPIPFLSLVSSSSRSSQISYLPSPAAWLQKSIPFAPGYASYLRKMISIVYSSLLVRFESSTPSSSISASSSSSPFLISNPNILLSGISGIGKSTLVQAFIHGLIDSSSIFFSSLSPRWIPRVLRLTSTHLYQNTLGGTETLLSFLTHTITEYPYTTPYCTIILLEDIDIIFTTKPVSSLAQRTKRALLSCIEQTSSSFASTFPIIWIGLTSNPYGIDTRIIGSNRFHHLIPLSIPNPSVREQILTSLLQPLVPYITPDNDNSNPPNSSSSSAAASVSLDSFIKHITNRTHGYTPADLSYTVTLALTKAISGYSSRVTSNELSSSSPIPTLMSPVQYPLRVWFDYFNVALTQTRPSLFAQVVTRSVSSSSSFAPLPLSSSSSSFTPSAESLISFDTILGMETILSHVLFTLFGPLIYYKDYRALNTNVPKGLLLHGASGNGKTYLAHTLVRYAKQKGLANVITIQSTDIISALVGSSELMISTLFKQAHELSPCILVIDHFELLAPKRTGMMHDSANGQDASSSSLSSNTGTSSGGNFTDRLLSVFLTELDGLYSSSSSASVSSLATSVPDLLDEAVFTVEKSSIPSTSTSSSSFSSSSSSALPPLIMVLGITENIHDLDTAILRPGRLDTHIYIDYPTFKERKELLTGYFSRSPTQWCTTKNDGEKTMNPNPNPNKENEHTFLYPLGSNTEWLDFVDNLSTRLEGWDRSSIIHLWEYAAMNAVRRQITTNEGKMTIFITVDDIEEAYRNYA